MKRLAILVLASAVLLGCGDPATELRPPETAVPRYSRQWQYLGESEYIVIVTDRETGERWTIWKEIHGESMSSQLLRREEL